ncbi:uncharacterized protein LOC134235869 [Saccostrea cucullata]|uniref:uncharacterized protein LOC134235869 n=1 Tax=Saccostrea cuccullata TaxID=36930 RepID=UPI002ED543C2
MNTLRVVGIICLMTCFSGVCDAQCDSAGYVPCLSGIKIPQQGSKDVNCTALEQVAACLEPFKSSCDSNQNFTQILQGINLTCGNSRCDFFKCFTDKGIDITGLANDPEKFDCESFRAVQPCFESQKSACEGDIMYNTAAGYVPQFESKCGRDTSKGSRALAIQGTWVFLFAAFVIMAPISP